jgi:DHA1 family multidrug resistance protein-like MFS transporter
MASVSWQRNLYIILVVEFAVLLAYGFTNPFMPFFIQDLGQFTDTEAALWSGLTTTVFGLGMFLSGPIWGIIADRWGRKPMVLRAIFGVAVLSVATGLSPNVYWVITFRTAQGLFSGTIAAASAMISASTPRERIPFAMGMLTVATFAGNTLGPFLGGLLADAVGYRNCFYIIAVVYFVGGMAVLLFTSENFTPLVRGWGSTLLSLWRLAKSRHILPLLIVICILAVGPSVITPVIPLIVKGLMTGGDIAVMAGLAFSLMGVVSTLSSLAASRFASGGANLKKMMYICCFGTCLFYLLPLLAHSLMPFITFTALLGIFKGGIMIASSSLIALTVIGSEQGMAYGLQQSASFLGYGIGPILGGGLASLINLNVVFPVAAGLYLLGGLLVFKLLPELKK